MSLHKSLKIAAIVAMIFTLTILTSTPGEAGIWEWLTGQQDSLIPIHDPGNTVKQAEQEDTPASTAKPITSYKLVENSAKLVDNVITRPLDAITPAALKPSQEGEARYVTQWVRIPTTRYFPQLERNEKTGLTHVVMKPCTSESWQLRRVPVTTARPVFPQLVPSFPPLLRPCDANTPLLGRILNPLLAPGCGGCIIPQKSAGNPTPAQPGTSSPADLRPTLDPNTLVPDSDTEGGIEIRNRPVDSPPEGESSENDSEAPAEEVPVEEAPAAEEETGSVLRQPAINPPAAREIPGQKELSREPVDAKPDKDAAAPYKLQPIPDTNRLPRINPSEVPRLINPQDKTAARPIAIPQLTPVSIPTPRSSLVRVTAVVPVTGAIRKLDDSGWIRQGK